MAKTNVWDCTWRGNLNHTSGKKKGVFAEAMNKLDLKKGTHAPITGGPKASSNGLANLHRACKTMGITRKS
jgi:hypothetical protein